ncbi:low temperature requirement protein A [Verrucosispora sp. WMMD1129]|uniref:low temperature requirement protein A n=1 Tax=Verrucosispora sp. WMMD1129 TaxID=3016093 RepID=UPI00249B95F2|nr:low temperature requirement protein A [Verrucosispora sp. WMMD1129]WFE47302.1 low temperature requirement protein A [Verrucosispora sp. WMMD1129]
MGTGGRLELVSWGRPGTRVTRLELFYDVVFVFAFLNVTTLTSENLTGVALFEMFLVLALLWSCWSGFAALGNFVRADQAIMPAIGFGIMASIFVLALTTDVAFFDEPGGLDGPLVFATAYLLTWLIKIVTFWVGVRVLSRRRALLLTLPTTGGAVLILIAAVLPDMFFDGTVALGVRLGLWVVALSFEYATALMLIRTEWQVRSAGHLAERHGLIVLVALGESVIALGLGAAERTGRPITWWAIYAAGVTLGIIFALWWLYFDTLALAMEQHLHGVRGAERIPLIRDVYTYLHLALIVGIIFFALGIKRMLARLTDPDVLASRNIFGGLELLSLYGGLVVYLLALVAMQWRMFHRLARRPLVAAGLLTVSAPVLLSLPTLVDLTLIGVVFVVLALMQIGRDRQVRRRVRSLALEEQVALEDEANVFRGRRL